jgi:hypothetical protein
MTKIKEWEVLAARAEPENDDEKKLLEEISEVNLPASQIFRIYKSLSYNSSKVDGILKMKLLSRDEPYNFWIRQLDKFPSFRPEILYRIAEKAETTEQCAPVYEKSWGLPAYAFSVEKAIDLASSPASLKILVLASNKIPPGTPWFHHIWRRVVEMAPEMSGEDIEFFRNQAFSKPTKDFLKGLLQFKQSGQ